MDTSRRAALTTLAGATALAIAAEAAMAPTAQAATTVGPWKYLAPGESIQTALNGGAKAILLGAGTYAITAPIAMTAGATITGVGQLTRILASATMTAMVQIGSDTTAIDGVQLQNLVLDCDGKATKGIDINIINNAGFYQSEPDPVIRIDDLWIYDAATTGIEIRGANARSTTLTRVRVRRAGVYGFKIAGTDNWMLGCEATTSTFGGAGFYLSGANNFASDCKAWFCRGHAFQLAGVRQMVTSCHAQDSVGHGFYVQYGQSTLVGCVADSCSSSSAGGTAGAYDGFYVQYDSSLVITGCLAYDRRPSSGGVVPPSFQGWGFNVPAAMVSGGRLTAYSGYDNLYGLLKTR